MALNWKNIKDPKLGMLDQIMFGKLKGCRVCDVIEDHHEYLIWAEKQGFCKFQQIVIETIQEAANFQRWEDPEVAEKVVDTYQKVTSYWTDFDDDIPF